jgi:hypothetical protein
MVTSSPLMLAFVVLVAANVARAQINIVTATIPVTPITYDTFFSMEVAGNLVLNILILFLLPLNYCILFYTRSS